MTLTTAQLDRAVGVLLGTAAGDALGAGYEFGPPRGPELEVVMAGGGAFGWEPGEWTDDTSMAIAIAEVAATGADLREEKALDAIVNRWHEWMKQPKTLASKPATCSALPAGKAVYDLEVRELDQHRTLVIRPHVSRYHQRTCRAVVRPLLGSWGRLWRSRPRWRAA